MTDDGSNKIGAAVADLFKENKLTPDYLRGKGLFPPWLQKAVEYSGYIKVDDEGVQLFSQMYDKFVGLLQEVVVHRLQLEYLPSDLVTDHLLRAAEHGAEGLAQIVQENAADVVSKAEKGRDVFLDLAKIVEDKGKGPFQKQLLASYRESEQSSKQPPLSLPVDAYR